MTATTPATEAGIEAWRAVLESPGDTLVGVDFDGTLAELGPDPDAIFPPPGTAEALERTRSAAEAAAEA